MYAILGITIGFVTNRLFAVLHKMHCRKIAKIRGIPIPNLKWYEWIF